jgi:hypothetical protein
MDAALAVPAGLGDGFRYTRYVSMQHNKKSRSLTFTVSVRLSFHVPHSLQEPGMTFVRYGCGYKIRVSRSIHPVPVLPCRLVTRVSSVPATLSQCRQTKAPCQGDVGIAYGLSEKKCHVRIPFIVGTFFRLNMITLSPVRVLMSV